MAEKIPLQLDIDAGASRQTLKSVKDEIKAAKEALLSAKEGTAEWNRAFNELGGATDKLRGINEAIAASDPGAKAQQFQILGNTMITGFQGAAGAVGLLTGGSEDYLKLVVKMQSAVQLFSAIQAAADFKKQAGFIQSIFFRKKEIAAIEEQTVAQNAANTATGVGGARAFTALKAAIISSGIGALIVALGLVIANWDKIKLAIFGANSETQKQLDNAHKLVEADKERAEGQDLIISKMQLQGASEEDILKFKQEQLRTSILNQKAEIETQIRVSEQQEKIAARNQKILSSILKLTTTPLQLIIDAVAWAYEKLGGEKITFNLADEGAKLIFDPEEVKKDAEAARKEMQKQADALQLQYNQNELQLRNLKKANHEKNIAALEKQIIDEGKILISRAKENGDSTFMIEGEIWQKRIALYAQGTQKRKDLELEFFLWQQELFQKRKNSAKVELIQESENLQSKMKLVDPAWMQKYAEEQKKIREQEIADEKAVRDVKIDIAEQTVNGISSIMDLMSANGEKNKNLQRALAIAQLAVDEAKTISAVIAGAASAAAATGPTAPLMLPLYIATGIAATAANFLKAKKLLGASDTGSAAAATSASSIPQPVQVQAVNNAINKNAIENRKNESNSQNNITLRAYVVESERAATQNKIDRLAKQRIH